MRFNETLLHDSAKTQTRAIAKYMYTMLIPGSEYHFKVEVEFLENLNYFFVWVFFLNGSNSVNQADSKNIENLTQFSVNSISKFSTNF